jgi:hypothetical protein
MCVWDLQRFFRARALARIEKSSLALGLGKILAILTLVSGSIAFAQSPPIVGRPLDFSGAVGGPFAIQWHAEPTEVFAEEPLTLALRIVGPGNLKDIPRPALGKLDTFKSFAVEDLDDRLIPGDPPRREFRYRLRPRSADVKEVPRLKFVYFNPRVVPAARGYQTTYADAVALTVKVRTPVVAAVTVPDFIERDWMDDEEHWQHELHRSEWLTAFDNIMRLLGTASSPAVALCVALLGPPTFCGFAYLVWRRWYPDAVRVAAVQRSRAAATAIRCLRTADANPGRDVSAALIGYLHDRTGLPKMASTPAEITAHIAGTGQLTQRVKDISELLHRCDHARFARDGRGDVGLAIDAERLILDWEAAP